MSTSEEFEGWAIVELMGHRRLGGYVRSVTLFGAPMMRLDVPEAPGAGEPSAPVEQWAATQFYGGGAIYCLTPTTEALARAVATGARPAPVHRWELPRAAGPTPAGDAGDDEDLEEADQDDEREG